MSTTDHRYPTFAAFAARDVELPRGANETSQTSSSTLQNSPTFYPQTSKSARSVPGPPLSPQSARSTSRKGAPHSPLSGRRSVPGMKKLLPLRLQSTLPSTSVASWLNSTTPDPNMMYEPVVEPWQDFGWGDVPWMQSKQDENFLNDVRPLRYRETPVYSEPGSPQLARAYFGKEDLCFTCLPPGSACEELCIVTKYDDGVKSGVSCSRDSYDECEAVSPSETVGQSAETSPTSILSSRLSDLSIKCRGEFLNNDENMTMGGELPRLRSPFGGCSCNKDAVADKWIESDSSRCSSPVSCEEVCDALATPLSPAKPNVIQVPRSLESPFILPVRSESLPAGYRRPTIPFPSIAPLHKSIISSPQVLKLGDERTEVLKMEDKQEQVLKIKDKQEQIRKMEDKRNIRKDSDISTTRPSEETVERTASTPPAIPFRRLDRRTQAWLHLKRRKLNTQLISNPIAKAPSFHEPTLTPPSSPSTSKQSDAELGPWHAEPPDTSLQLQKAATNTTVESIREHLRGFPLEMLSLDSHCVAEIRRRNQSFRVQRPPERLSLKSNPPNDPSLSETQFQVPLRRRAKRSSLLAPLRSSHFNKRMSAESKDDEIFSSKTSQRSLTPSWIEPTASADPADLKSLRSIFPNTDDWWRGVLYAHLVTYNYVRDLQRSSELSSRRVPFKAAMRLGISQEEVLLGSEARQEAELSNDTLVVVLDGLISCISQITGCMEGTRNGPLSISKGTGNSSADLSFVRALAEVVKTCETKGRDQDR